VRISLILFAILTLRPPAASQGYFQRLTLNALFQVDLDAFADPQFRWTTNGESQVALNTALTELKEGSVDHSVLMFEQALKLDSVFWPTRYYYAVSLRLTAQFEKARKQLERLSREQDNAPVVHLEYGRLLQQDKMPEKAKDHFQKAIRLDPSFAKAHYALGVVHAYNGDLGRARKSFDRCVELDPHSAEAFYGLAMVKLLNTRKLANFDLDLLNKSLKADSSYRPALFWRGFIIADRGDFKTALLDWNRLVRMTPGNPYLLNMRALLYIELERYPEAYSDFKNAILLRNTTETRYLTGRTPMDKSVDLQNALTYINSQGYGLQEQAFLGLRKGFCLMIVHQSQEAMHSLNESIRLQPSAAGYLLKAILFEEIYQEDSAQACYVQAIQYDNDLFDAHKKRALHFVRMNDWKSTYKEFNEMKRINKEAIVTYRIGGLLKSQFRDYFGCIIDLTRVLKEDSTDVEAWSARALCRSQIKDHKGALEDIRKALQLEPEKKMHQWTLVHLQLEASDTLSAIETLNSVKNKFPGDCDIFVVLAELYYKTSSFEDAMFNANLVLKNLEERNCDQQVMLGGKQRAHALHISALVSKQHGQYDLALDKLNESLGIILDLDRLFDRCRLLLELNRMTEALRDLHTLRHNDYKPAASYYEKYLN